MTARYTGNLEIDFMPDDLSLMYGGGFYGSALVDNITIINPAGADVINGITSLGSAWGQIRFLDVDANDTHTATFIGGEQTLGSLYADVYESAAGEPGYIVWNYRLSNPMMMNVLSPDGYTDTFALAITDQNGLVDIQQFSVHASGAGTAARTLFGAETTVSGTAGDDTITGPSIGEDILTGGAGSDTFKFSSAVVTEADTITDFTTGAGGDKLDLHDILNGYVAGTSNAGDFVHLTTSGSHTMVFVDVNGPVLDSTFTKVTSTGYVKDINSFVAIATLQNVTGVTLTDLLAHQNIIL